MKQQGGDFRIQYWTILLLSVLLTHSSCQCSDFQMQLQWKAEDHCRAVFTEDGRLYEAVICSIDNSAGTCVVRYLGYGNEEEQALTDLLPSEATCQKSALQSDMGSEVGMEVWHLISFISLPSNRAVNRIEWNRIEENRIE